MSDTSVKQVKKCDEIYRNFTWEKCIKESFDWPRHGYFNLTHEAIDRHAADPNKVAIYYLSAEGREERYTFRQMKLFTSQLANVLRSLGVQRGDKIARMLPRCIENYVTFLGTWKAGAADVPVFTAYGPEAIEYRVKHSGAKVLITDAENRKKVERISGGLPGVKIVVLSGPQGAGLRPGDVDFWQEMGKASQEFAAEKMGPDDLILVHYTSGTTGRPKGAVVTENSVGYMLPYARYALDVKATDMFWGFADPGWIYALLSVGTSVLVAGGSLIVYGGRLDAETWYQIMERFQVTNFSAAPTLYRMVMAAGDELRSRYRLRPRRFTSGGEYLNPQVSDWFKKRFGVGISDQYGLTEVGMLLGNYPFMPEKVGSMGRPLPGYEVKIMDDDGREVPQGQTGIIMVKKHDYFLAKGYWGEPERWQECFVQGEWYNTKDLAAMDEDGYFFYKGRNDDVISSAGYRIGPAEVESAVMKHPAVAEAAAVGKPDQLRVEIVKAFVVLRNGYQASPELAKEIQDLVRTSYAAHLYPREVEFLSALPKTESGKIMRRELRKRA
jgi:acetyl-CoA synthetase